jgi:hypothetical protein
MMSSKTKVQPQTQTPTTNTQAAKPQQTTNSLKGTIIGLLSGGKTLNCQVTYPDNKGTGTIVVADKKFAGDFTMKGTDGKETTGHMISDGTFMYVWSSGLPMGIKMNLADAKNAAQKAGSTNQSVDINQEVGLNCSPWAPDNSKFTVPTNINFRDMSQLLQQVAPQAAGKTVTPGTQTGGTSPCDQITDPTAKAACTKALQGQGY